MLQKGSQEYKRAGEIANKLQALANTDRYLNNSTFAMDFEELGKVLCAVKETTGFASQVAETIESKMNPYGKTVAYMSSKQAWIIACTIVENNIEF